MLCLSTIFINDKSSNKLSWRRNKIFSLCEVKNYNFKKLLHKKFKTTNVCKKYFTQLCFISINGILFYMFKQFYFLKIHLCCLEIISCFVKFLFKKNPQILHQLLLYSMCFNIKYIYYDAHIIFIYVCCNFDLEIMLKVSINSIKVV